MKASLKTISLFASAALFTFTSLSAVETQPVGYSTISISPGTGSARVFTTIGLPLYSPATNIDGASNGVITSLTQNTLTVTNAGWTSGQLSDEASPFIIRITSGSAEGRNLLISRTVSNGTDTLTIDTATSGVSDLTSLGIVAGVDQFEITECDTLLSLFGEPTAGGVIGASSSSTADVIYIFKGSSWAQFYFDTDTSLWTKVGFGSVTSSNEILWPDAGIIYSRLSNQSSKFVITGTVPDTGRNLTVNGSGLTPVSNSWPTDILLSQTGFESIPSWISSTDSSVADIVYIFTTSWQQYYHDGTNWRKRGFGSPLSDSVVIPSGTAVLLSKTAAADDATLSQAMPYTL